MLSSSYVSWIVEMPGKGDYRSLRSCVEAVRDLHGVDMGDLSEESLRPASERIVAAYEDESWPRGVLRGKARMLKCVLDPYWDVWIEDYDRECFSPALRVNMFLFGYSRRARDHNGNSPYDLAEKLGFTIESFDDYLDFIDKVMDLAKRRGYVCLKSAIAYDRTLYFEEVDENEARRVFGEDEPSEREKKLFSDYIMEYIVSKAGELSLPVQFHTSLAKLGGSNPMNLLGLIKRHPETKFILFHGGYPWISEVVALAFTFPNIYLDVCWLPTISPSAAVRLLREAVEVTGGSKLMWGGDCWVVEGTYGALKIMRRILAEALSDYVERGYMSLADTVDIAEMILQLNPREIFGL